MRSSHSFACIGAVKIQWRARECQAQAYVSLKKLCAQLLCPLDLKSWYPRAGTRNLAGLYLYVKDPKSWYFVLDMVLGSMHFPYLRCNFALHFSYEIRDWCSLGLHEEMKQYSDSHKCFSNIQHVCYCGIILKLFYCVHAYAIITLFLA